MRSHQAGALVVLVAGFFVTSCGGSVDPTGDAGAVQGQVRGASVPTASIVGNIQTQGTGAAARTTVQVLFANVTNVCGVIQAVVAGGATPGNLTTFVLGVSLQGNAVPAGTYDITNVGCAPNCATNTTVSASYSSRDASCNTVMTDVATEGSITFTSVGPVDIAGSFDVVFPAGDHLTGSFSAPECTAGAAVMGARSCMP